MMCIPNVKSCTKAPWGLSETDIKRSHVPDFKNLNVCFHHDVNRVTLKNYYRGQLSYLCFENTETGNVWDKMKKYLYNIIEEIPQC